MKNSKKEKINPLMKDGKNVKNIKVKGESDDENVVKKFIIITVIIAILIGGIYVVTEIFNKEEDTVDPVTSGAINYDKVSVGTLLNRPYEEYYVIAYNIEDKDAVLYSTLLSSYMQNSKEKDYIKIYYCDLNNKLNASYYNVGNDNKSNPKAKKTEEFDFGDLTLLKIENGKVTKYLEDYEEIKKVLK